MQVKLPNSAVLDLDYSSEETTGYYLVSNHWTVINDTNITFVRKNSLGYCYNLKWAGPLSKYEAQKLNGNGTGNTIISHGTIRPFLIKINNEVVLPNSLDVRKILGLDAADFQLAN